MSDAKLTRQVRELVRFEIQKRSAAQFEFDCKGGLPPEPLEDFIMGLIADAKPMILKTYTNAQ